MFSNNFVSLCIFWWGLLKIKRRRSLFIVHVLSNTLLGISTFIAYALSSPFWLFSDLAPFPLVGTTGPLPAVSSSGSETAFSGFIRLVLAPSCTGSGARTMELRPLVVLRLKALWDHGFSCVVLLASSEGIFSNIGRSPNVRADRDTESVALAVRPYTGLVLSSTGLATHSPSQNTCSSPYVLTRLWVSTFWPYWRSPFTDRLWSPPGVFPFGGKSIVFTPITLERFTCAATGPTVYLGLSLLE